MLLMIKIKIKKKIRQRYFIRQSATINLVYKMKFFMSLELPNYNLHIEEYTFMYERLMKY